MTNTGAEALIQAIVRQACNDWTKAVRRLHKDWGDKEASSRQRECERFFRSDYFYNLTGVSGKDFIEMLWRTQE